MFLVFNEMICDIFREMRLYSLKKFMKDFTFSLLRK